MKKRSKLTLGMLTALVTGNIIGSGAFLLPADLAKFGSIGILALIGTSLGAIFLALIFARMSKLVKNPGGPYAFITAGLGDTLGTQMAYGYWLAIWIGNAAIIVAAMGYLDLLFPILHNPWMKNLVVLVLIWGLTAINCIGLKMVGWVQIITTIFKFIPIFIVIIGGWFFFHPEWFKASFNVSGQSNYWAFSRSLVLTMWLFLGIESATISNEDAENPDRNIPIATILGTLIAMLVYLGSTIVVFGMIPNCELIRSNAPFALASQLILGDWGKYFVALGALIACLGSLNGWILVSAQIPIAAAKAKIFPAIFGKFNRNNVPVNAIVINSFCISLLLLGSSSLNLLNQFDLLIILATVVSVLAYFYTVLAHFNLAGWRFFKNHWGWLFVNVAALGYTSYILLHIGKKMLLTMIVLSLLSAFFINCWLKGQKRKSITPQ